MPHDNHPSLLAISYAQALLDLATEANSAPVVGQEMRDIQQIIQADPAFAQILSDPAIGKEERGRLLHRTFDGRASDLIVRFLGLVNEKARLNLFSDMAQAYGELLDKQQGKVEVDVTVVERLDPQQLEAVRQKVGAALKRDPVIHQYVDSSIIGGLILRVQDQLIDGSVRAQLQSLRRKLVESGPRWESV
jgi:F-type H+-transporting ATPase subunit delta